jgi:hypothetical protein
MNYYHASQLRNKYLLLKEKNLIKSSDWIINDIIILPEAEDTLLAYAGHISSLGFNEWVATGFDHDYLYKLTRMDVCAGKGKVADELTLYALLKYKKGNFDIEYKCESITNLISAEEVDPRDIQDLSGQFA